MGDKWEQIRASDRLLVEVPAWLADRLDVPDVLRGYVSFQSGRAVWFVSDRLSWAGWLPKSQINVLEVAG